MTAPVEPITGPEAIDWRQRIRWTVWTVYVLSWSIALEVPQPIRVQDHPGMGEAIFTVSKLAHLSAYALLAGLTGWLRPRGRWRWIALAFLLLHGVVSEVLQWALPFGRHGAVEDVLLDWLGIAVGVGLTWRWWFGRERATR